MRRYQAIDATTGASVLRRGSVTNFENGSPAMSMHPVRRTVGCHARRICCRFLPGAVFSILVALSNALVAPAFACSLDIARAFKPTFDRFEYHFGPAAQKHPSAGGDYWEPVPRPAVEVVKLSRGKADPGMSCDDAGIITLSIALPASSTYSIEQFGVYFRVIEGAPPDMIFPPVPLVGLVKDNRMTLLVAWLDGHPSKQIPLDLKVEAFFVTNGLDIGASTIFEIRG